MFYAACYIHAFCGDRIYFIMSIIICCYFYSPFCCCKDLENTSFKVFFKTAG